MKTTILLPTYNEEKTIIQTILEVQSYATGDIFVVDSYSTDRTAELVNRFKDVKLLQIEGRGKGRAIRQALKLINSDYYVMLDSDFTYPARHIQDVIYYLKTGYDVVMGYRKYREPRSMPLINVLGNKGLSLIASVVCQEYVRDVCTGLWGFNRRFRDNVNLTSNGFTLEADLFKNAVKRHYGIMQIPISYRARPAGSATKLNIGHGFEIAKFLLRG